MHLRVRARTYEKKCMSALSLFLSHHRFACVIPVPGFWALITCFYSTYLYSTPADR